jgi:hypothetical protein
MLVRTLEIVFRPHQETFEQTFLGTPYTFLLCCHGNYRARCGRLWPIREFGRRLLHRIDVRRHEEHLWSFGG